MGGPDPLSVIQSRYPAMGTTLSAYPHPRAEEGIAARNATFETTAPEWPAWDAAHLPHRRFDLGHRRLARSEAERLAAMVRLAQAKRFLKDAHV